MLLNEFSQFIHMKIYFIHTTPYIVLWLKVPYVLNKKLAIKRLKVISIEITIYLLFSYVLCWRRCTSKFASFYINKKFNWLPCNTIMSLPLSVLCFGIYHKLKRFKVQSQSILASKTKKDSSPLKTLINKTIITKHFRPILNHLECLLGVQNEKVKFYSIENRMIKMRVVLVCWTFGFLLRNI